MGFKEGRLHYGANTFKEYWSYQYYINSLIRFAQKSPYSLASIFVIVLLNLFKYDEFLPKASF